MMSSIDDQTLLAPRITQSDHAGESGEQREYQRKHPVGVGRADRQRQQANANHRERVTGKADQQVTRQDFRALLFRGNVVDRLQAAAITQRHCRASHDRGDDQQRHRV